jgi:MFS family permease
MSQTGVAETPVQVESMHYNVAVGKVTSKVGLITNILGGVLFFLGLVVWYFASSFVDGVFGSVSFSESGFGEVAVFTVAAMAALIPAFIVARKRLEVALQENPAAIEDIYFKKVIRRYFTWYVVLSIIGVFAFVYSLLASLFLASSDVGLSEVLNAAVFLAVVGAIAWFYWGYQQRTKR